MCRETSSQRLNLVCYYGEGRQREGECYPWLERKQEQVVPWWLRREVAVRVRVSEGFGCSEGANCLQSNPSKLQAGALTAGLSRPRSKQRHLVWCWWL